jgi:tripeptide aminopeptidase
LASESKTLLPFVERPSLEVRRVAHLAEQPALFDAQCWFTRERAWISAQHLELCRIPAPTFFEQARAEWVREQLTALGWNAKLDRAGNVLASFGLEPSSAALVVSAHLDTVFAPNRPEEVYFAPDGRLVGPGVSDNGAGLSALLALARLLAENGDLNEIASSLLLVANVGEEGEGNLSGMRFLCRQSPQLANLFAFVVLDGPSTDHITAQALASRRFEISLSGPGGHSWNDYGNPNPVHAVGDLISSFIQDADAKLKGDRRARCSYNFGIVEGGSSVNSIPSSAHTKLDLRSEDANLLDDLGNLLSSVLERTVERANRAARNNRLTARIKELGSRPGGQLPLRSPLLRTIQAVDAYLNIRSRVDCASTDANVPLSMGLPAISIGAGGQGGGAHSQGEWYQPDGRDTGLRRVLLLLAALHGNIRESETKVAPGG